MWPVQATQEGQRHRRHVTVSQWRCQWWHQIGWIIAQSLVSCPPCISDSAHMTSSYSTCHTSHHNTCHVSRARPQMIRSSSQTSCDGWVEGADNSMVTRSDNDQGAMSEHRCHAGAHTKIPGCQETSFVREIGTRMNWGQTESHNENERSGLMRSGWPSWPQSALGTTPWHWTADYVEESWTGEIQPKLTRPALAHSEWGSKPAFLLIDERYFYIF